MMDNTTNKFSPGEKVSDLIYQFYQPKGPIQLEVVFIHGLDNDIYGDAYWKTWLARDGTVDNVWPMTWLPDEFSFAKVFALKYDASKIKNATNGRLDLFLVGEKLVQEMVMFGKIGQNGVPVVFVCHGFGGLVAKQIVVNAKNHFSKDIEVQNLLKNIGAILFYSTPHHGLHLAKSPSYFYNFWGGGKSPLWEISTMSSIEISRLNQNFEQVVRENTWILKSAAETHVTKLYGDMVVGEASSRYEGGNYLALSDDYFDVVRPKSKTDSSYLLLINCLKKVLDRYAIQLAPQVESLVPNSFVRLEEQEEAVKKKVQETSIVGLVGMGGIGKTTLARAVYQSICKDFEKSSYLDDVKWKTGLDEVLITLLHNFGIKDRKTGYSAKQSTLQDCKKSLLEDLKMYVKQHKVLVVVDDVGTKENFASLLEYMDFLNGNKESKVIVTCRNWQVLKYCVQDNGKYEVEPMRFGEDIELFSYHAFLGARTLEKRRQILLGFLSKDSSEDLIDEIERKCDDVVKACGGLPLSLEVMGCYLGGYLMDGDLSSKDYLDFWGGALEKLLHAEPLEGGVDNDRLWKVLQISYDSLHEKEQNMFLDIACFFCGSMQYGEQTLLHIWGGKPSKKVEFRNLKERCLVKIDEEDGNVTMHDQLRDMGRSIVRHQCKRNLSEMTRVWNFEDVSKLLQSNEIVAPQIQGLSFEEWSITPMSTMKDNSVGISKKQKTSKGKGLILDCPALRLLNLYKVEENAIEAICIKDSSCVQWLCLKGITISKLPEFVLVCNKLCILDISDCKFFKSLDESIGNLVHLLELNLSRCKNLVSLPESLGDMVNLTTLILYGCKRLTSLPNSIGMLVNLSTLDMTSCEGLTSLPNSIGNLVKLSNLFLEDCQLLTSLPNSIGKLVNLSTLDVLSCKGLTGLPDFIGNLVKLSMLNLRNCELLTSLPDSIGKLVNLSSFSLLFCQRLASLPDSIGKLVNLSSFSLLFCERLTSLPDSIGKLVKLSNLCLLNCKLLTCLPNSIGKLVNLSGLDASGCKVLTSLPDSIGNLVNLSYLNLERCELLTHLPDSIGKLVNLSELFVSDCKKLTSLPDSICNLVELSSLYINKCEQLTSLPDSIGMLVNLSTLDITDCKGLTNLPDSIGNLVKLSKLSFRNCKLLTCLPDSIGKLVNLSTLDASSCKGLIGLPDSIGKLVKLLELNLQDCELLTSLPHSIGKLVNLSSLFVSSSKRLTSLSDSIGNLVKLSSLSLKNYEQFSNLSDSIGKLVNLSKLNIIGCKGLTSLQDCIGKLVKLSSVYLEDCELLTSEPNFIGKLINLSELHISSCMGLTNLPDSFHKLVKLSNLSLRNCELLTNLPDSIGMLVNLSTLDITNCKELTSLPDSIGNLINLSILNIFSCKELTSLPDSIGNLVNLSILNIFGCKGLTSLPHSIGNLVKLSTLNISGCTRWEWIKTSNVILLHKLQQNGCSKINLPDGRSYYGKYSTKYCSSNQAECDGCGLMPISTNCWHCDICPGYDLCESCYKKRNVLELLQTEHNGDHPLTAIVVL